MQLSEEFAALHLRFAKRVRERAGLELTAALRDWTPAGRQAAAAWAEIGSAPDAHWLWRAYQSGPIARTRPSSGCFHLTSMADEGVLRLHFANAEGSGVLGADRLPLRRRELATTLAAARAASPRAELLRGGSWLYNLASYRTLFPPSFLASATAADPRKHLGSGSLWGQFLRGDGTLYEPRVAPFVRAFERARTPEELVAAFPLPRLDLLGPIDDVMTWSERYSG
jgi:hypothetical protein